ncbi:hypothetical protein AOB60_20275 [Streptomyces noursei]|uniref:Uncharacterized protein n=2 Tax=Streptomyces noursei TaxID=1971 RepID=A0A2N8PP11_STRNR|nr:hypothetical protein AOB60_20275 [Streptomyces noursei]
MDTYAHGYGSTGHYARPGTHKSYCGRELQHTPNTGIAARICGTCAKAEKRDRVAAEQGVAGRAIDGPTLAERAGVRYATVGKGRRIHFSPNDDTLCGREISQYVSDSDLLALFNKGNELCVRCTAVAEQRAYSRALAAASPLAAAAEQLADTVEATDAERVAEQAIDAPSDTWTIMTRGGEEIARVEGATVDDMTRAAEALPTVRANIEREGGFARRRLYTSELTPADKPRDVEGAIVERTDTVELLDAVEGAEAADGTWRGAWIGEQAADDALFNVEQPVEQGALFSDRTTDTAPAAPIVVRMGFARADLDRLRAKADADRAAHRAEFEARRAAVAAKCQPQQAEQAPAPRVAEQTPARRVIDGAVVAHNGRTKGTAPKHSTDPDALAALAAVADLRLAEVTDHTDITAQPGDLDHQPDAWGFLAEPRGNGRVALYWLSSGRYVRPDDKPWSVELEIGADRLRKGGWRIEPGTHRCVMAWRPTE